MGVERPGLARSTNIGAIVVVLLVLLSAPAGGQTPAVAQKPKPAAGPTAAQKAEPRVFVTLGAGVQAGVRATDRLEWDEHRETATASVDYGAGAGPWFGGGIGMRLWRQIGAGVAVSRAQRDGTASIEARIPHPFAFNQPREISGDTTRLTRSETSVHIQMLYVVPWKGGERIILSAGPSRFHVEQDAVTAVRFTEEYPFDVAAFQRADTIARSASAIGFNVGAEAAYMFTRAFGVAGTARFTRATVDLARPDGVRLSVDAGGLQAGFGLRLAF
jgi:hypothetical protein